MNMFTALFFAFTSFVQADTTVDQDEDLWTPALKGDKGRVDLNISKKRLKAKVHHGFRMGYGYVNAPEDHDTLRSNWLYLLGYEVSQTVIGGSWINVLFVQNFSVVGINQSLFIPSGNLLAGFEFNERFQLVTGLNLVPSDDFCHMVMAAGWTPNVGDINIPFHVSYVPDYNNNWRAYLTTGVNW